MISNIKACPNCKSSDLNVIETIEIGDLEWLYNRFKVSIHHQTKPIKSIDFVKCSNCSLGTFSPMIVGDDLFYKQLQSEEWYYLHEDKSEFEFAKKYINPNSIVLDIGSGRGAFKKYIECNHYQGLEFSSKAIELAEKDGVNVIAESIETHSLTHKNFYDVAVIFQVLEHVPEVEAFISSTIQCIKPGGHLIIAVPNNDGFIGKTTNHALNLPPHHVIHWNEKSLLTLGKKFNIRHIETNFENLTPIHKIFFWQTYIKNKINSLIFRRKKLVDQSLIFLIINKVSYYLARFLKHFKTNQRGHTVIVVYEKPL